VTHPLIQRLFDEHGFPEVTRDSHQAFISQPGVTMLFFAGDPNSFKDVTDVAVVLPELVKAFQGGLIPGVVTAEAEKELQRLYGFGAWPALVFLRDGGYLGTITGIQNWSEYLRDIRELMNGEVKSPRRTFKIPVVSA
jgi:hydrogenase-1 operon protein HyaE